MAKKGIVPTKSKLLALERELSLAKQGHELLEQKRQILVMELMRIVGRAEEVERRADESLAKAYRAMSLTFATMGKSRVKSMAQAVSINPSLSTQNRSIMGAIVPAIRLALNDQPPYFAHGGASLWTDEAVESFKEALQRLTELAELKTTALRLAREVSKTLRRVNALEKVSIPDHIESISYIRSVLEESERERFGSMKLIKARLGAERGGEAS
ncbi:MAG TPA: V-type ATP synthase subunit D [bacterium]|nr:V-type ATP synthase subunit D [bacterium]